MPRIGINYHQVEDAIHQLQGQNKNPTVDRIREILKTGSKSTITKYLQEWRRSKDISNSKSSANSIPEELLSLVKGLWQQIQTQADEQVRAIQSDFDTKEKNLHDKLTKHYKENKQQAERIHTLEEKLNVQQQDTAVAEQKLQHVLNEHNKLTERYDALKIRVNEAKEEKAKLYEHLKQVQINLEHYQQAEQKLKEQQAIELDNIKNQYQNKINLLENEIFNKNKENQAILVQLNNLEQNIKNIKQENDAYKDKVTIIDSLNIKYETLQNDYNTTNEHLASSKKDIDLHKQNIHKLEFQLEQALQNNQQLENKLSKAKDKINILREEKSFISHEKANLAGQLSQMQATVTKN